MPQNFFDLFSNINRALRNDGFLTNEFYSKENLQRFSGASDVQRFDMDAGRERIILTGLERLLLVKQTKKQIVGPRFSIERNLILMRGINFGGLILLNNAQPDLTFEKIIQIFGPSFHRPQRDRPIPPSRRYERPTHPFGNATIRYVSGERGNACGIGFEFRADGTFNNCSFSGSSE